MTSPDSTLSIFNEILEAYEYLCDPDKKKDYDFKLFLALPVRGTSIFSSVLVTFEESLDGCSKSIKISRVEMCKCMEFANLFNCILCQGSRRVTLDKKVNVSIPAGITDGFRQVYAGLGNVGEGVVPAGDLIILFNVMDHPNYVRSGDDVTSEYSISLIQATLGGRITVPFLFGTMDLDIQPGTQPNQVLMVKDQGFPSMVSKKRGNYFLKLNVEVPKVITSEQRDLLLKFDKISKKSKTQQ
eukprot:gene4968-5777_t